MKEVEELQKEVRRIMGNFIEIRTFDRFQARKIMEKAKGLYETETDPDRREVLDEIIERAKDIGWLVDERREVK